MSAQTPRERIEKAIRVFGESGTLVFDIRLLRKIALEAEAIIGDPDRYDLHRDYLCSLVGEYIGAPGHDWTEWRNEYIASGGDLWHERVCRRCGEIDYERVP